MLICDRSTLEAAVLRPTAVTLHAPGRLHLGFLDPAGSLGRSFGSLGLVIEGFETVVEMSASAINGVSASAAAANVTADATGSGTDTTAPADTLLADSPEAQAELPRVAQHLARLRQHTGCHAPLQVRLLQVLPAHAGLGSGTQLALAVGRAFAQWHGLEIPSDTLAGWLGRGKRSGIGIAGFDQGGLLLDGGPGAQGQAAPVLARLALPGAWRVLVVQDTRLQGLSGVHEVQAIGELPPFPREQAAEICHQMLLRVLPGAASADFSAFAAGLNRVQELLGDHFAPAQGGSGYTSAAVGQLLQWIAESRRGPAGPSGEDAPHGVAIGQSSWGPTGFAILPSVEAAESAIDDARRAGLLVPGLSCQIVRARSCGARLSLR